MFGLRIRSLIRLLIQQVFEKDDSPYRAQLPAKYKRMLHGIKMVTGESLNKILMRLIEEEIQRMKTNGNEDQKGEDS